VGVSVGVGVSGVQADRNPIKTISNRGINLDLYR
jgi:hypothetical protein